MRRAILLIGATLIVTGCNDLDEEKITGANGFSMRSNLMCSVKQSSDRSEIGRKISLIDVETDKPKVLFEGQKGTGSATSTMKKIYETGDTLILQLIATYTGSVDTFVIDKETGKFARVAAGNLFGVYAHAALGSCE